MAIVPVDHGFKQGAGTFSPDASGAGSSTTTVSDASIPADARVCIFPGNAAAGLLLRTLTCSVASGVTDGAFVFDVSATAAGTGPDGTEVFHYIYRAH